MAGFSTILLRWLVLCLVHTAIAEDKLPRSMILKGGHLDFPMSIGMLIGAMEGGFDPDATLWICGPSFGASIVGAYETPAEWEEAAMSREVWETYRALSISKPIHTGFALLSDPDRGPFSGASLMTLPDMDQLAVPFRGKPFPQRKTHRVIIVGTKAMFNPDEGNALPQHRYRETYFTVPDTATRLQGFSSALHKAYPNSHITPETEILTDTGLLQAARVSITDPYFFVPVKKDGASYVGGFININPIELARHLSHEVLAPMSGPYASYENHVLTRLLGYDVNHRLVVELPKFNGHGVRFYPDYGLTQYYAGWGSSLLPAGIGVEKLVELKLPVRFPIPRTYEEFRKLVRLQLDIGKMLGKKMVQGEPPSTDWLKEENKKLFSGKTPLDLDDDRKSWTWVPPSAQTWVASGGTAAAGGYFFVVPAAAGIVHLAKAAINRVKKASPTISTSVSRSEKSCGHRLSGLVRGAIAASGQLLSTGALAEWAIESYRSDKQRRQRADIDEVNASAGP